MAKTIGIDLGTTNSVVAIMEGGDPVVIANEEGNRTTPSVVAWDARGEVMVGQIARRQAVTNPQRTIYSIKRLMGRKYDEVSEELKGLPYEVICTPNGDAQVSIDGKPLAPPEISAMILIKLKKAAESYLGEKVGSAVITVPAYFNDAQRQATKDAGRIAGLNVERIVNEPTAAALAYGLDKAHDQVIAVYDFGGGTFDISVLEVGDGVVQVISTNGDTHLGGDNIDQLLIEHLCAEFRKETGLDVSKDPMVIQRLKDAAERAKIELSSLMEAQINLPFLTADASGPKHLDMRLSRAKFEDMIAPLVERTLEPVRRALSDAKRSAKDINEVVLVGGSTRIPLVQKKVSELFGKEPHKGVNPDEVVALGAAVQAGVLTGEVKDLLLLDVTPLSLGVETLGAVMTVMIPRNTTIPAKKSETYSTAVDSQTSVEIHVLQGERSMAAGNRTLGKFHLEGIMPAPRGVPKVEVTFDIDANGIVNVSAKDAATGKEQRITITASSGLAEQDIQRMVTDAEQHAGEDEQRRKEIETRNRAEQLVYTTERTLNELRPKLPSTEVAKVESAIADLKRSIEANDAPLVARNLEALTAASHKLAEIAYQSPATAVPTQNGNVSDQGFAKPPEDNDIIDADFHVSA